MPGPTALGPRPERLWPLVGRDHDIDVILDALTTAARVVAVHGPTGVGKSRLLAEVAARAGDSHHVLEVAGSAILAVVPLGALSATLFTGAAPYDAGGVDPARLFAEGSAALASAAGGRPVLLVVDDVSWLDPTSQTLIAQLAAAGRARLVVAVRHGEPLPEALVATWNVSRDLRVDLAPLSAETAQTLLETVLGAPVGHRSAGSLHTASGGNPLFLRELVIGAVADQTLAESAGVWQLSGTTGTTPTLRDLVLARIDRHGTTARDALERLAVCGPLRTTQFPDSAIRPTLAALESDGLVRVDDDGRIDLAQPVYRSVLTTHLPRLRREDLLAEQAAHADDPTTGADGPDVLQRTLWRLGAGLDADPAVLLTAARLAAGDGDHEAVIRLTAAGLNGAAHPDRPALLLLHADALLRNGRVEEALSALADHPRSGMTGLDAESLHIARLLAVAHLAGRGPMAALDLLPDDETSHGDPAMALTRVGALVAAGRPVDALRAADRLPRLLGDSEQSQVRVAHARAIALACVGREDEAIAAAERSVAYAGSTGGAVLGLCLTETNLTLATVQHLLGHYGLARTSAVRALAATADSGDEILARSVEFLLGRIALDSGHLSSAERWLNEAISGAESHGPPAIGALARLSLTTAYAASGADDRARATLAGLAVDLLPPSWVAIARAWAEGSNVAATLEHVRDAAEAAAEAGNVSQALLAWQVAIDLDRADAAVAPLRALAGACDSGVVHLLADHAAAAVAGDHARLVEIADEWESRDALRLAAAAVATATRALAGHRAAAALRARAEELVQRCDGLDVPVVRTDDGPSPLTPREREIAGLAAGGASSKEIAAQLYLSSRTVDNHLQSVYTKLGVSGRQELAAR